MLRRQAADFNDGDRRIVIFGRDEIGVSSKDGATNADSNYRADSGVLRGEGLMMIGVVDAIVLESR